MTALLADALATYRLTRLVTIDTITQPVRERVFTETSLVRSRYPKGTPPRAIADGLDYLITCPWCVSVYAGAVVAAASVSTNKLARFGAYALALSGAVSLLHDTVLKDGGPTQTGAPGW